MDSNKSDSIDLSDSLLNQLSSLYMSRENSDFVFVIENERIFAHKFILCLRCEYFRLMLSSGLREAILNEVDVQETPLSAFKDVLYFMYSGRLYLQNKKIDDILDILFLGHRYEMHDLVEAVTDYLGFHITEDNVCEIHSTASLFSLVPLMNKCRDFMLCNGYKMLSNPSFMSLNVKIVIQLLSSDNFCAEEIDVFNAVIRFLNEKSLDEESYEKMVSTIRLPLISWNDLIAYVWPSGLFAKDDLLTAIEYRKTGISEDFHNHRKCCEPLLSLRSIAGHIADKSVLHSHTYAQNLSVIVKIPANFTIAFDSVRFVNYLEIEFGNCDRTGYSYYIEALVDDQWKRIVDYTDYQCYSTQYLYFAKTALKSIRVHCSHCRAGGTNFIVNDMKCMLREIPTCLYGSARRKSECVYSNYNVNKSYAPLYGPQLDLSSKARPSANKALTAIKF